MRRTLPLLIVTLAAGLLLHDLQAAPQAPKSGPEPKPKELIGGPFVASVVTGKRVTALRAALRKTLERELKDNKASPEETEKVVSEALKRYTDFPHDPVTEFGLNPVVGIFVNNLTDPKRDEMVRKLLEKVEQSVKRHHEAYLHAFAIFLSPGSYSSATAKEGKDTEALIDEATQRDDLAKYVRKLAGDLKLQEVVIGFYPYDKLKGYGVPERPGITVLVYAKHAVLKRYSFGEGQMTGAMVDGIIKDVGELMKKQRRQAKPKGGAAG
jgi:hypothetical protein